MAARPEELAASVPDGALVALPPDYSLPSMALVHALIRRQARHLCLLGVPVLGLSADLLIGAGCVAEVHSSAVSLGEAGLAPRFSEAADGMAMLPWIIATAFPASDEPICRNSARISAAARFGSGS